MQHVRNALCDAQSPEPADVLGRSSFNVVSFLKQHGKNNLLKKEGVNKWEFGKPVHRIEISQTPVIEFSAVLTPAEFNHRSPERILMKVSPRMPPSTCMGS